MEISQSLLFFFSALGAFNGLLLSFYFLFFAKPRTQPNIFLGLLLLSLSIRIGKSVFFYFNEDLAFIYLQLGVTVLLFTGPSLYLFLKSLQKDIKSSNEWKWHYGTLLVVAILGGGLYPFETNVELWRWYVIDGIYYLWLIYMMVAAPYLYPLLLNLKTQENRMKSVELWVLSIYYGCFIVLLTYMTAYYTSYIAGALSFSFVLYLAILLWVIRNREDYSLFEKSGKYEGREIDPAIATQLLAMAESKIISQELYKNPSLKVSDLAKAINIPGHRMSQLLNEYHKKNFPTYINTFRIDKAKQLILQDDLNLSLEGIGYECGFNSKSTFFATFKKMTGQTPARFKEEALN